MKVTIKSHSIRFRISAEEQQQFANEGKLNQDTPIPFASADVTAFRTELLHQSGQGESCLQKLPFGLQLVLNSADFDKFTTTPSESVYLRHQWPGEQSQTRQFVAYLELDKKKDKSHRHDRSKSDDDDAKSHDLKREQSNQ